jgi:hypothetical protein
MNELRRTKTVQAIAQPNRTGLQLAERDVGLDGLAGLD